jgi:protein required for attachment to host cells
MYRACIAVADTQHSRIYLFDRTTDEDKLAEHFVETAVLASTHVEHHGGPEDNEIAQFARHVLERVREVTDEHGIINVFLVAGPRMLGQLRNTLRAALPPQVIVTEVAHELTKLAPHELRAQLGEQNVLPPVPRHSRPRDEMPTR